MRRTIYLFALLASLFMAGCTSESGKIHGMVEDFLDATIADGFTYDIEKYENWDSTFYVKSESVADNQAYAREVKHFKKDISYLPYTEGDKLIFVRVIYHVKPDSGNDTTTIDCKQTFYLDKDLKGIVCVKEN